MQHRVTIRAYRLQVQDGIHRVTRTRKRQLFQMVDVNKAFAKCTILLLEIHSAH